MGLGEGVRDTSEISSSGSSSLSDLELDLERWSEEEPGGSKATGGYSGMEGALPSG